jgi:hypothetical protein
MIIKKIKKWYGVRFEVKGKLFKYEDDAREYIINKRVKKLYDRFCNEVSFDNFDEFKNFICNYLTGKEISDIHDDIITENHIPYKKTSLSSLPFGMKVPSF